MTELKSDILVKVSDEHLPELASLYHEKAPWAPHINSFVCALIKWKKFDKFKDVVSLFSPNNCWREDGTIIAISKLIFQDLFVFTFDDKCTNLYKGLKETNLINYDERTFFYAVHEKHYIAVKTCLDERQIRISRTGSNFFYAISPEEAKNFIAECPPEVYVKKLEPSAAKEINELWPHKFPNSEKHIAVYIEINGGYGVFLKSTNEMVAWIVKKVFDSFGIVQTKKEHRKRGYASLVIKVVCREIADEDGRQSPVCTIIHNNRTSISMFEKMGFRCIGACICILINNIKSGTYLAFASTT